MSLFRMAPALMLCLAMSWPTLAWASCSRPLQVPVSPMGFAVTVDNNVVGGIFPELLRRAGEPAGCQFVWSVVPRARIEVMFEAGQADLLIAATRSPRRDQSGVFVPLMASRATLVSLQGERAPIGSMDELLKRRSLRLAVVRGYEYGEPYSALLQKLGEQNRLVLEVSPTKVARLLNEGLVDATIVTPLAMAGAILTDARLNGMLEKLRIEPLEELPWGETGVYLSRTALAPDDRAALEKIFAGIGKSRALLDAFKKHYPAAILAESIRAR